MSELTGSGPDCGWRAILTACRRRPRGPFDMRRYWRGRAYLESPHGEAEAVVRARAFAGVLQRIGLRAYARERIAGSPAEFCADALPAGLSEAAFGEAVGAEQARGQRGFRAGFDHACPDYPRLLAEGIAGMQRKVADRRARSCDDGEIALLRSFGICLDGLSTLARRYASLERAAGNDALAGVLERVSGAPPATFHEALQLVWLVHIAFVSEGRYAMALGRIDQYLRPFYEADVAAERLTRAEALDLLCHLWVKIEELGEVTNITIGGQTADGRDAVNEVSSLCLEATRLVQSPHTNLSARLCDRTPASFHRACFECIRTGVGFPALFNDESLIPGLVDIGIPEETARDYCLVGCIETHLPGRQQAWGDGVPEFAGESNIQCLERALRRMREEPVRSYARLEALFREELRRFFGECAESVNRHIARFPPARFPDPFLSVLTRDCIERARDVNDGGARFSRFYKCAGAENLATLADSMAAVKSLVFDNAGIDYDDLIEALDADFADREPLRNQLLNAAPKYGNDQPAADEVAAHMLELVLDEVERLPPVCGGGRFVACAAGNIHNIVRGRKAGATPDGRHAGEPLSDATSPHFGRDRNGPTAVLNSMARTASGRVLGGRVANMRFDPEHFRGTRGSDRFLSLTQQMVRSRIQELQINFTDNRTLLDARDHPERHRDLVVRVSGFSAYFTQLAPDVQNDVIRRRAHR